MTLVPLSLLSTLQNYSITFNFSILTAYLILQILIIFPVNVLLTKVLFFTHIQFSCSTIFFWSCSNQYCIWKWSHRCFMERHCDIKAIIQITSNNYLKFWRTHANHSVMRDQIVRGSQKQLHVSLKQLFRDSFIHQTFIQPDWAQILVQRVSVGGPFFVICARNTWDGINSFEF